MRDDQQKHTKLGWNGQSLTYQVHQRMGSSVLLHVGSLFRRACLSGLGLLLL